MNDNKTEIILKKAIEFKKRYPFTVAWRLKAHSKIVAKYINPGEEVYYVFTGQYGNSSFDIISTYVYVLTNKRLLLGQKRLLFGHFYKAITPEMFNDISLSTGLVWGRIHIDTVKEEVHVSNLQKKSLDEIETNITEHMMKERKKAMSE